MNKITVPNYEIDFSEIFNSFRIYDQEFPFFKNGIKTVITDTINSAIETFPYYRTNNGTFYNIVNQIEVRKESLEPDSDLYKQLDSQNIIDNLEFVCESIDERIQQFLNSKMPLQEQTILNKRWFGNILFFTLKCF